MPQPSGLDETLKLEAVYLSAPIPRNLAGPYRNACSRCVASTVNIGLR
jgi:hypothetical protein